MREARRLASTAASMYHILSSPAYALLTISTLCYLAAVLYLHQHSYRDPGSIFFDPQRAYRPIYSEVRKQQAEEFIAAASTSAPTSALDGLRQGNSERKRFRLCVGLPSVKRKSVRYLRSAVGSLLQGLTPEERREVYFIVFIAETDPNTHPAFTEPWLAHLADRVLVYDQELAPPELQHLVDLEQDPKGWREKELYDYKFVLNACYNSTDAPYIAIIEDDTLALDGWYHRTVAALESAHAQSERILGWPDDFLYVRLFYTEEFFGFNSEDWMPHVFWSLTIVAAAYGLLSTGRQIAPSHLQAYLSRRTIALLCVIVVPLFIVLFFVAGKVTMLPLPYGVNLMNRYGCCSQGLVFLRQSVPGVINLYDQTKVGFVDTVMEDYAVDHGYLRYALTPSVIQHIGRKSSKVDTAPSKHDMTMSERVWNFAFELNDPKKLRQEHHINTAEERERIG